MSGEPVRSKGQTMMPGEGSTEESSGDYAQGGRPGSPDMFDGIVEGYDFLNRILSLGMDQRWRRSTVQTLDLAPNARVLDLATGTGDLALALSNRHGARTVVGLDPSPSMLASARRKQEKAKARILLIRGDAHMLPFSDGSFDAVTVAFGVRNFSQRALALHEIRRVLEPGGRLVVLELSPPPKGLSGLLTRLWVRSAVPFIGARFSSGVAYRYLEQSVCAFPRPAEFAEELESTGLTVLEIRQLTFGACCLFVAERSLG